VPFITIATLFVTTLFTDAVIVFPIAIDPLNVAAPPALNLKIVEAKLGRVVGTQLLLR